LVIYVCLVQCEELAQTMHSDSGVSIQDRTYNFRTYTNVFIGSEAVTWLVNNKFCSSRDEAVEVGKLMMKYDLFHHVAYDHDFKDDYLFYRFPQDDPISKRLKHAGPSVASVLSSCGVTKSGKIIKKGQFLWNERFMVVKQDESKVYLFETNLDPSPKKVITLGEQVQVREVEGAKKNAYCFAIVTPNSNYLFACPSSKVQEEWMAAVCEAGANLHLLPEENPDERTIYAFTCRDIRGEDISMSTFEGKVCLIVNVASK